MLFRSAVKHSRDKKSEGPWVIQVLKVDRSDKKIGFYTPLARGQILGVSRLSEQASLLPKEIGTALAGVNGDFYEREDKTFAGDPRGLQLVDGEMVSGPSTFTVWFDAEETPHLDEVKGDFKVRWPNGKTSAFGLNEQRNLMTNVLYTPTYGESTRI